MTCRRRIPRLISYRRCRIPPEREVRKWGGELRAMKHLLYVNRQAKRWNGECFTYLRRFLLV